MGLRPTHRNETHLRRHPRESGGPPVDSRLRGNDVIFERAPGVDPSPEGFGPQGEESRTVLKILRARFLAPLGMTA
jgi:hypothetical protein